LIRTKKRTALSIILESAEVRDVHQAAMCLAYGARAVNPYLAHEAIAELIDQKILDKDYHTAIDDYNKGIINGIIDIFEGLVNAIIEGLNALSFDVPDWVPGIGGEEFSLGFEKLSLPRLAKGMVIQGGQPFAAILGDQAPGQVNIETPLRTMVEAFNEALDERGSGAGGTYTFVAEIDGEVIYKKTVEQDELFYDTTGHSAFEH